VGHLNGFFVPRGGKLNKPIFKSSNARGVSRGVARGVARIDRRISPVAIKSPRWALGYSYKGARFGVAALLAKVSVALVSRQHRRKTERLYC